MNRLFYGDNLDVLRRHVRSDSVDLVYLDPPFKSGKDYNVIFSSGAGKASAQIQAFEDTWHWGPEAALAFDDVIGNPDCSRVAATLRSLRKFLGESDMMAYLCMMAPRLIELRRALKPTGSLYLHCDPTASHYLKVLLDAVFGDGCFRNEVIWRYRRWPTKSRQFQKMHDVLLFYSKATNGTHYFEPLYGYEALAESTVRTYGTKKQVADFSSGHRKPSTVEEESRGPVLSDVWEIGVIAPVGKERLGYPTQKPEALLGRVILASSREGDVVLDPFCGCGTAVVVAEKRKRQWIGIDITHLAINLIKHRLHDSQGPHLKFEVIGEPKTIEDARELAANDRFQFQFWALGLVGARPEKSEEKRGKDRGIDGCLMFRDAAGAEPKDVIFSVKSGHLKAQDVRDLRGVLDREDAAIGALITLEPPSRDMVREAASAGFYHSPWGKHPRLQIVTVEALLSGTRIDMPAPTQTNVTYKRATRAPVDNAVQTSLPFDRVEKSKLKPGLRKPSKPPSIAPGLASTKRRGQERRRRRAG
jgi:DNA modification methylase